MPHSKHVSDARYGDDDSGEEDVADVDDDDDDDDDYYDNDDDEKSADVIAANSSVMKRALADMPLLERLAALKETEEQQSASGSKRKKKDPLEDRNSVSGSCSSNSKTKAGAEKRRGKNAPMVMRSSRPVSRFRDIHNVAVSKPGSSNNSTKSVDPRFSDLQGQLSYERFTNNYSFLNDYQKDEIETIKKEMKKLNKNNTSSAEVKEKLKHDMTLIKQQVDRRERVAKEGRLLREARDVERERVRSGAKKPFFLKKAAQKELLLEDKFNSLKQEGKLKKFLEKKRKKNSSKEKKWLPQNFRIDT